MEHGSVRELVAPSHCFAALILVYVPDFVLESKTWTLVKYDLELCDDHYLTCML